ncbi:MAG: pimeloyl-ACP methyl ester carboxylesterase [Parvicella sp.]|jgi:pimeloyl-ACP methyl ester carboxylesterase
MKQIRKMKYIICILFLGTLAMNSCGNSSRKDAKEPEFMGKFDSLVIAREKGPSTEYYYENMVHHFTFPSKDSLLISADMYEHNPSPVKILLCHQAGYSRGEYMTSAILLSQMGYNALAIDQRSGEKANGIVNQTAKLALADGLSTEYLEAKQDIEAAIDYLYECNGNHKIILVGSSYSASLALMIGKNNNKVKSVAAFSPGEYLTDIELSTELDSFAKPLFVTSSKMEIPQVTQLIKNIDTNYVDHFKPETAGIHGSRALWSSTEGHKAYWKAFLLFLERQKEA